MRKRLPSSFLGLGCTLNSLSGSFAVVNRQWLRGHELHIINCTTKDIEESDGFKTCNRCHEAERKCCGKNKTEYNQARRDKGAKASKLCEECGTLN